MNSLRGWILVLCAVCFLAGLAAGLLARPSAAAQAPEAVPFGTYQALLRDTFDLNAKQSGYLRVFLNDYHRRLEDLRRPSESFEPERQRLGYQYRSWIRDYVIPPDQRAEFDRLAAGYAVPVTTR